MHQPAAFWDRVAARYAKAPMREPEAYEATLARVRAHLGPEDRVLELGCGTGTTAVALAPHVAAYEARDISANMLAIGRERAVAAGVETLRFAPGDLAEEIAGGPFDAVLAFNVLHLVPDLDGALGRIHAALAPGGRFISKTPCLAAGGLSPKYRAILMLLPALQWLGKAPGFLHRLAVADLERRVRAAGFEVIEAADLPAKPPSRLIVARRGPDRSGPGLGSGGTGR
jgi:SAM-dependent methyltransferase